MAMKMKEAPAFNSEFMGRELGEGAEKKAWDQTKEIKTILKDGLPKYFEKKGIARISDKNYPEIINRKNEDVVIVYTHFKECGSCKRAAPNFALDVLPGLQAGNAGTQARVRTYHMDRVGSEELQEQMRMKGNNLMVYPDVFMVYRGEVIATHLNPEVSPEEFVGQANDEFAKGNSGIRLKKG
jgi:hypothetical protein